MVVIRRLTYALTQLLSAVQMSAVVLAALIAADFFFLTPNLTSSVVLEDRVDRQTAENMYGTRPVPAVVQQTLTELNKLSFPRPGSTALTGTSAAVQSQGTTSASMAAGTTADPFPLADLCGKSRDMVDGLFPGACEPATTINIPFFDRGLLFFNAHAATPVDVGTLREAASYLARSTLVRATVTISNTGQSTAINMTVLKPDPYRVVNGPPTSLDAGKSVRGVYESAAGAPVQSNNGAVINNPSFPVKADLTGPIDPQVIKLASVLAVALVIGIFVLSLITGPQQAGLGSGPTV